MACHRAPHLLLLVVIVPVNVCVNAREGRPKKMTEEASCQMRFLSDLPDEVLGLILVSADDVAHVMNFAAASHRFHSLAQAETIWRDICWKTWPQLGVERERAPSHLQRLPPARWKQLFQARVRCAECTAWRVLLPLYDQSLHVATTRPEGWVVALATHLLHIERVRARHSLQKLVGHEIPYWDHTGEERMRDSEGLAWAGAMLSALLRGCTAVLACAGDDDALAAHAATTGEDLAEMRARSVGRQLDAWHELVDSGYGASVTVACQMREEAMVILLHVFEVRSALEVICEMLYATHPVTTAYEQLTAALAVIDENITSLRLEGCDLSVTTAQRSTTAIGAIVASSKEHWWWRIQEPTYVSGGCPLISG